MKYICKLNKEKLLNFKEIPITEDVIITDERIQHVKDRHSSDYERYINEIYKVIEDPDYICLDKNNSETIFMLKSIENVNLQVVIKLQTKKELKDKKNSILTFWNIRNRNYEKVIKNRSIKKVKSS